MRTTINIGDQALDEARFRAEIERRPLGDVVTELMLRGLRADKVERKYRNGVPLLPVYNPDAVITLELVNELRDELP